mgnify:CR=1 FL=1
MMLLELRECIPVEKEERINEKKREFMTAALAAMLILSLTACGGEKKPAETKESVQASQETTAVAAKETEAAATETTEKETETFGDRGKDTGKCRRDHHDEPEASDPGKVLSYQNRKENGK